MIGDALSGFWNWHSLVSFFVGFGARWALQRAPALPRLTPDRLRIAACALVAVLAISWIGWRTQDTANRIEAQTRETTQFALDTNGCLGQVVDVLTTRVQYNDQIAQLDGRRWDLWEQLVAEVAAGGSDVEATGAAFSRFQAEVAALNAEQSRLTVEREESQYPGCP